MTGDYIRSCQHTALSFIEGSVSTTRSRDTHNFSAPVGKQLAAQAGLVAELLLGFSGTTTTCKHQPSSLVFELTPQEYPVPWPRQSKNESQYLMHFKANPGARFRLRPIPMLSSLTPEQRQDFVEMADSNHVVIRAFEVLNRVAGNRGNSDIQAWAMETLAKERARIYNVLNQLEPICNARKKKATHGGNEDS